MANTISNDAIWEKLSEISEKIGKSPDSSDTNKEMESNIKNYILLLGKSNDSHFEANRKNMGTINNNILQLKKLIEESEKVNLNTQESIFNKKTVSIGVLCTLVFILLLFCMKQQNDFALQQSRYFSQYITIRNLQLENDSLQLALKQQPKMKNKNK